MLCVQKKTLEFFFFGTLRIMDIEVFNQGQASTTFVFLSLVLGLIFF